MVDIAPASTVVLRAELVGVEPLAGPYELTLLPNGLLHRDETTVTVTDARGGSWEATPVVDRVVRRRPRRRRPASWTCRPAPTTRCR